MYYKWKENATRMCESLNAFCSHLTGGVGLQVDILEMLYKEVKGFVKPHQRYIGILQDEVKIKADLVYSKHTGMYLYLILTYILRLFLVHTVLKLVEIELHLCRSFNNILGKCPSVVH
jgi:hypothetical protein